MGELLNLWIPAGEHEHGRASLEYAMILALVGIVLVVVISFLSGKL